MARFQQYIGIDYSGCGTPLTRTAGLQVYVATPKRLPKRLNPPGAASRDRNWCRREVAEWLIAQATSGKPFIAGLDFSFSLPLAYFQRYKLANWGEFLEDFVTHWPTDQDDSTIQSLRPGNARTGTTDEFRITERWTSSAKSNFQFGVPGQVACSTHTGIPWLLRIKAAVGNKVYFWPFDGWEPRKGRSVIAEVFPPMLRHREPLTFHVPCGSDSCSYSPGITLRLRFLWQRNRTGTSVESSLKEMAMTRAIITTSFNRVVQLQEIVDRLSQIDIRNALSVVTRISSRQLWFPESEDLAAYINLVNLSHLAKATVLYCGENGRPVDLADDETGDLRWLLTAINSMQWYSRAEVEANNDEAIISFLVRQTYVRNFVGDHPVSSIARAYAMFHEILPALNRGRVDIDEAMRAVAGVDCHDVWIFCAAIHMFYYLECSRPSGPWVFRPDFFADSPRRNELAASLGRVLNRIARTPQEIRALYGGRKYHDPSLPEEYWLSEFNILRDYPLIRIGQDDYCCPYTTFAWMRGTVGYYFDLVNHYADIERRTNPRNPNPLDNIMSQVLGDVFQEYVGVHLRSLPLAAADLRPEFIYTIGGEELRTPDWLLLRVPTMPVYFECKARRPALPLQTRCRPADREAEIESVLSRALGQLTVFLRNVIAGRVPSIALDGDWRVIYALVLYESFPFHALPDIRDTIDRIAERIEPEWRRFRNHVLFVPLSIQELELAVQLEKERGVLIERQFQDYALYRRTAPRMVMSGGRPIFARHFLDYAFERWGAPAIAPGEVCTEYWNQFSGLMYRLLYGEDLADYEARQRNRWVEENAYFRWLNSGRPVGAAVSQWLAAEREYEELEHSLGMAPYMAARLNAHYAITRSLEEGFA